MRRFFSLPLKWIFRKDRPERIREVVTVISVYTVILLCCSWLFYMDGAGGIARSFRSEESVAAEMTELADRLIAEQDRRARYRIADRLKSFGEPAADHLIRVARGENDASRIVALNALNDLGSPKALPLLIENLEDPVDDVRWKAAEALGMIGSDEAVGPLLELLGDEHSHIRIAALKSLASIGSDMLLDPARDLLSAEGAWIRAGAVDALGILGTGEAAVLIATALDDENEWVRTKAIVSLVRCGSDAGCSGLEALKEDPDWEVRIYASEAVKRLCGR
jgi:HEAT repeat protein